VVESWRSRISGSPVLVLGLLAAAAFFGLAFLVGWITAGSHERLAHATRLRAARPVAAVPLFRPVAPLPKSPPARPVRSASAPAAPQVPRLIIGSG
jgi:hypothetical protein